MTQGAEAIEIDPVTLRAHPVDAGAMVRRAAELCALSGQAEDPLAAARFASHAAMLFVIAGHLEQARPLFDFALARQSADMHPYARTVTEIRLAQLHQAAGQLAKARVMLEELVHRCSTSAATRPLLDFAHQHLGKVLFDAGEDEGALASFRAALELRKVAGAADLVASTELALAAVARRLAARDHARGPGGER